MHGWANWPVVWQRYVSFPFDGRLFEQHESIFVVKTARFDVHPTALTELEVRSTTGSRSVVDRRPGHDEGSRLPT